MIKSVNYHRAEELRGGVEVDRAASTAELFRIYDEIQQSIIFCVSFYEYSIFIIYLFIKNQSMRNAISLTNLINHLHLRI
jgi:hypothetical protein